MKYKLKSAVWEITMGCNMRCKHCGSSCTFPLADELSTSEAVSLCDDLRALGLEEITLSGGEPFTRKDWYLISERLSALGVKVNIISNGWLIDDDICEKIILSGVNAVGISVDGMETTHDIIRKKGSYCNAQKGMKLFKEKGIPFGVCTTVSQMNYSELESMYNMVRETGANVWQMQLAVPMGNMKKNKEKVLPMKKINELLQFIHIKQKLTPKSFRIEITDCFGYNTNLAESVRSFNKKDTFWNGCQAGISNIGILHNGDIIGCTSFRNREYIEGNIRDRGIKDIWMSDKAFLWNRNLKKDQLTGFCTDCQYGASCKAGCTSMKYFTSGTFTENLYCSYLQDHNNFAEAVKQIESPAVIERIVNKCLERESYNFAEFALKILLDKEPENNRAKRLLGFVYYKLNKFEKCAVLNRKLLAANPKDSYALKGFGLALAEIGQVEDGLSFIKESLEFATGELVKDCINDLEFVKRKFERV